MRTGKTPVRQIPVRQAPVRHISVRLGFIPLLDAALPIIAAEKGFAARHGLDLHLMKETSWANIRDRLAIGQFEAAHMLAPMPVAAALGLAPLDVPVIAPMALGLGGNAITVSGALWQEMLALSPRAKKGDPFSTGGALRAVVAARAGRAAARLVFAVVHPYSAHNYELRYWLAVSGINPDIDMEIAIVPPPFMPDALASGRIDGFCVGEPWNSVAARTAGGTILLTKSAIWRASPEKVLGMRSDWAEQHPDVVSALIHAMLDAAEWCGKIDNRPELISILSSPAYLDRQPVDLLPAYDGSLGPTDEFLTYTAGVATFPWKSHAEWFLHQMVRWGQVGMSASAVERARASYRPEIFRAVASARGISVPTIDDRPEGPGDPDPVVPGTLGDIHLPTGGFFDRLKLPS